MRYKRLVHVAALGFRFGCSRYSVMIALFALVGASRIFALTTTPASQQSSPPPGPVPRLIKLLENVPHCQEQMRARLSTEQRAGSPEYVFSFRGGFRRVNKGLLGMAAASPMYKGIIAYANGSESAAFMIRRGVLSYGGAKGADRCLVIFDTRTGNRIIFVTGKAGEAPDHLPALPKPLSDLVVPVAHLYAQYPLRPPVITFGSVGLKGALQTCNAAVGSLDSGTVSFASAPAPGNVGRYGHVELWFGPHKGPRKLTRLMKIRAWQIDKRNGEGIIASTTYGVGEYAKPLPIHLTTKGLKKLGFKVTILRLGMNFPKEKPLTPAELAKVPVMRERFEKWAGVWPNKGSKAGDKTDAAGDK